MAIKVGGGETRTFRRVTNIRLVATSDWLFSANWQGQPTAFGNKASLLAVGLVPHSGSTKPIKGGIRRKDGPYSVEIDEASSSQVTDDKEVVYIDSPRTNDAYRWFFL